jgi:peptidoglycan/xylan/chitin deacetylase (PgdA/CDA1 family)
VDPGFEARLARRREQVRLREIRRRRILLGSVAGVLLLAAISLLLLRGPDSGEQSTEAVTASSGNPAAAGSDSGEGPKADSGNGDGTGGAQPDDSWQPYTGPVPILMYHVIGDPVGEVPYPDLWLSESDFQDQVDWLEENGYTAVTLVQVQNAWYDGGTLPDKPVVLSFDDGVLGQYVYGLPILREKGWAGQLNLKAEGSDLSTEQVRKMHRAGWEIASHTINHPDLTTLDPASLEQEIAGSRQQLEDELGIEVVNFCYPAGQYDDTVIAAVKAAGYRGATTVNPGLGERSMPFELNRIRIDRGDSSQDLAGKLASAGA